MQAGAQQISDTVSLLRRQLDEVDARIAEATAQLQQATGAIYAALGETEQGLEQLGAQARQFPKVEPVHTGLAEPPPLSPPKTAKARPAVPKPHRTLSDGLLDLLDRILKE